jgi:hypothetical protein
MATPIRNLKDEVRVSPLGIHLDSNQAKFRVRLQDLEASGVIREAAEKVERWIGRRRRQKEKEG